MKDSDKISIKIIEIKIRLKFKWIIAIELI